MARVLAAGLIFLGTAALAGPPAETPPKPVSVYPAAPAETPAPPTSFLDGAAAKAEPARPVSFLDGTTVPACPTACDTPCPDQARHGLFTRRTAESKTVCCDAPPELQPVLARTVPVTPCVPPVCTESCSTCGEKPCGTPLLRGLSIRTVHATSCETDAACPKDTGCGPAAPCAARSGGCWDKIKTWLSYRTCPPVDRPCFAPNPYQPSVFLYVPCREESIAGGCTTGCSTGSRHGHGAECSTGARSDCGAGCSTGGRAGLLHGPRCSSGTCSGSSGLGLFDRIRAACGFGGRRECHGDGSHRVSDDDGKHCHLVRDCSGATEIAGTQLIPGFRFAAAEQIRLYGGTTNLPTAQPHWPVPATPVEPEKPKAEKPAEKPMPETAPDPKKKSGSPTGLSVNRPFTKP